MTQPNSRHEEGKASSQGFGHLCDTCEHQKDCGWLRENGPRALACEEFAVTPTSPQVNVELSSGESRSKAHPQLLGLCQNCDEAERCAFPKPAGGVWHCEEYR